MPIIVNDKEYIGMQINLNAFGAGLRGDCLQMLTVMSRSGVGTVEVAIDILKNYKPPSATPHPPCAFCTDAKWITYSCGNRQGWSCLEISPDGSGSCNAI